MSITTAAAQLQAKGEIDQFLFGEEASLFTYQNQLISSFAKHTAKITTKEFIDYNKTLTVDIPFSGDLLNQITFHIILPPLQIPDDSTFVCWTNVIGYAIINYIEVLIGERSVVRISGELMEILDYLSTSESKANAGDQLVGRIDDVNILQNSNFRVTGSTQLFVRLPFWFCKKLSQSLPLITIPNQLIKLRLALNDFNNLVNYDGNDPVPYVPIKNAEFIADYYLLTPEEKFDFQMRNHQYPFEQYNEISEIVPANAVSHRFSLNFNFPVKELIIVFREIVSEQNNDWFNYGLRDPTRQGEALITNMQLYFNGNPRFDRFDEEYYRTVTSLTAHTNPGSRNIYVIPFADKPEQNQSSGSANFSLIESIDLYVNFVTNLPHCRMLAFAISYNLLEIDVNLGIASVTYLS